MNLRSLRPDTADRIRPAACIRLDGKVWAVDNVALAPTVARPSRIAFTVIDPAGSMAQTGEVIHLDAGEIVHQTWDPRIDRPTADDLGLSVTLPAPAAAEDTVEDYCGDPCDPLCGPDMGLPWCNYHAGTSANQYEYAA